MVAKINKHMSGLIEALNNMVVEFLEGQKDGKGKVKVDDAVEAFKGEEVQAQLTELVKQAMPKQKRAKALKDPQAPKKNKNAYMFFCEAQREQVKLDNQEFKQKEVMKELGRLWQGLSDKKKAKFNKLAEEDKARYTEEMKGYERPSDEELAGLKENQGRTRAPKGEGKTAKKKRDKALPKGKTSAFLYFAADHRKEVKEANPTMSGGEVTSELGVMWKAVKDTKKAKKYLKMAEADKARYTEEMEKYNEEHPEAVEEAKAAKKSAAKKTKKVKVEAAESDEEEEVKPKKAKKAKVEAEESDEEEEVKPKKAKKAKVEAEESEESEEEVKPKKSRKLPAFIPKVEEDEEEALDE
jgi:hypothetical protein